MDCKTSATTKENQSWRQMTLMCPA